MTVRNNLGIYSECATGIGAEAVESHSSFSYIVCLNHSTEAARIRNMGWKSGGGGGGCTGSVKNRGSGMRVAQPIFGWVWVTCMPLFVPIYAKRR